MPPPATARAPRPALVPLVDLPPYRITALPGTGPVAVLSCASIGHDPDRPPSPEFVRTATAGGRPALFLSDDSRGWGTAPGLATALDAALARLAPADGPPPRLVALGQSMGAVLALIAAQERPVEAVLAIGPQSFLGPQPFLGPPSFLGPAEPRWSRWTAGLAPFAPPRPRPGTWTVLMHGLADDAAQAAGFAPAPGLDHILFPGLTHSGLAAHLKARGCLAGLLEALIAADRRRLLRIAASAGGRLRRSTPIAAHQP